MIKLYEFSKSRSVRIRWLLRELDAPYESLTVNLREGEHLGEDYKKIHPLGKVPAIQDGDLVLFESGAIVNHLCESHFEKGLIPDPATHERALYDQWMFFTLTELDAKLWTGEGLLWRYPEESRSTSTLRIIDKEISEALAVIEKELSLKTHIVSNHFYGVDVILTQTLLWAQARGHCGGLKKINAYIERNTNRAAFPREAYEKK